MRSVEGMTAAAHDLAMKLGNVLVAADADHEDQFMALVAVLKALGLPPTASLRPASNFYSLPLPPSPTS